MRCAYKIERFSAPSSPAICSHQRSLTLWSRGPEKIACVTTCQSVEYTWCARAVSESQPHSRYYCAFSILNSTSCRRFRFRTEHPAKQASVFTRELFYIYFLFAPIVLYIYTISLLFFADDICECRLFKWNCVVLQAARVSSREAFGGTWRIHVGGTETAPSTNTIATSASTADWKPVSKWAWGEKVREVRIIFSCLIYKYNFINA